MSENYSTAAIRAPIPCLKGKTRTEACAYFVERLGEPLEKDETDEGEIDYFSYEPKDKEDREKYWNAIEDDDGEFGVELVLFRCPECDAPSSVVTIQEMNQFIEDVKGKGFDIDEDRVGFFTYTWYNGVDEPIEFVK